jgi:nitrogen fixation protein FixH
MDDGLVGQYRVAVPMFNGGTVIHQTGNIPNYAGLFSTDGCGNNVPFSGSFCINMAVITNAAGAYMSDFMLRDAYVKGIAFKNHSFSARTQYEAPFWSADEATRNQEITFQVTENFNKLKEILGIKITNFIAPSHDPTYDPITTQMVIDGYLKFVNNIGNPLDEAAHSGSRTAEYWESVIGVPSFVGRDFSTWGQSLITRTPSDFNFINTKLSAVGTSHAWFTFGIHNIDLGESSTPSGNQWKFLDFKYLMEGLASNYGKNGTDTIWMTSMNDVYEYLISRNNSNVSIVQTGNVAKISLDFSGVNPEFTKHGLSLLLQANANITSIVYEGFDETSHKINYKSLGNNNALINTSYRPAYEAAVFKRLRALVSVENLELTFTQADKDIAQGFVNGLTTGAYRDGLQARINAVVVVPDSAVMQIDFGRDLSGYTLPFPWNSFGNVTPGLIAGRKLNTLSTTTSIVKNISLEVIAPFANFDTNFPATYSTLPFPYEACRDVLSVAANTTAILRLSGLNLAKRYDFNFYTYRGFVGNVSQYTINGTTVNHAHKTNLYGTSNILNVIPSGAGTIDISIKGDAANIGYIGVINLTEKN